MIGSSVLGSSFWNSDPIFGMTVEIPGVEEIESSFSAVESWSKSEPSSYSASPVHSSSSDDIEWPFVDGSMLPITDTFVSKLLEEEESVVDSLDLNDLDWVSLSESMKGETSATDSTNEVTYNASDVPRKRKRTKSAKYLSNSKSWSRMTSEEKYRIVHALTEVISRHLDLSQQIEVIKLIDPSANLSPNATEFAINLSYLNDGKLKRIKEYVKIHTNVTNSSISYLDTSSTKSSSRNCHPGKRRQKKYKSSYTKELKLRERKVIQQDKKEKQSGLFVMEKVIKKLSNPSEENEDVNILE